MPYTWLPEALKAQAVAARTYALAVRKTGGWFDLYPDTRSQVYHRGIAGEEGVKLFVAAGHPMKPPEPIRPPPRARTISRRHTSSRAPAAALRRPTRFGRARRQSRISSRSTIPTTRSRLITSGVHSSSLWPTGSPKFSAARGRPIAVRTRAGPVGGWRGPDHLPVVGSWIRSSATSASAPACSESPVDVVPNPSAFSLRRRRLPSPPAR